MLKCRLRLCGSFVSAALLTAFPAWAQPILPAGIPSAAPEGAVRVGVAAAVKGTVEITPPGAVGRIAASGQPIFMGDAVTTNAQGVLQILLLDETAFTIGPNSAIVIDEFVYDPATSAGKISARVVKGTFRFVTGKIAKKKPEDMEVKLPSGTIGIRGTIVAGFVQGESAKVVLLGPGPRNNTGDPPGRIVVSNMANGKLQEVALTRPGFGTEIKGVGAVPSPPAQVPEAELNTLLSVFLSPPPPPEQTEVGSSAGGQGSNAGGSTAGGGGPGTGGSAGGASGEGASGTGGSAGGTSAGGGGPGTGGSAGGASAPESGSGPGGMGGQEGGPLAGGFSAGDPTAGTETPGGTSDLGDVGSFQDLTGDLGDISQQTAQDTANQSAQMGNLIATQEQLRSIETGIFHYKLDGAVGSFVQTVMNGLPVSISGTISVQVNIDFGARQLATTVGLSQSKYTLDTLSYGGDISAANVSINPQSFATGTGPAVFQDPSGGVHQVSLEVRNIDGDIAKETRMGVIYNTTSTDGAANRDEGSTPTSVVMQREAGAAP